MNDLTEELLREYELAKYELEVLRKRIVRMDNRGVIDQYLSLRNYMHTHSEDEEYKKSWDKLHRIIDILMGERYNSAYYQQSIGESLIRRNIDFTYSLVIEFIIQILKEK